MTLPKKTVDEVLKLHAELEDAIDGLQCGCRGTREIDKASKALMLALQKYMDAYIVAKVLVIMEAVAEDVEK